MGAARKAFGHISELLKGLAAGLHLPDAPSGCPKRSEGGSPATARRKCVRCTPYKRRPGGASKRLRRRQPPLPLPVRYAGIARPSPALTESTASVLHTRQRGGVLRRDIRVPEAKRGRVPCRNKEERQPSKTEKLNTKPLSRKAKGFSFVRDTGIEPVTSSVSGKRATAAPIALTKQLFCCEVRTGFEPAYTALQAAA